MAIRNVLYRSLRRARREYSRSLEKYGCQRRVTHIVERNDEYLERVRTNERISKADLIHSKILYSIIEKRRNYLTLWIPLLNWLPRYLFSSSLSERLRSGITEEKDVQTH